MAPTSKSSLITNSIYINELQAVIEKKKKKNNNIGKSSKYR